MAMPTISYVPRKYSDEELVRLYPRDLDLTQIQVLTRHGERAAGEPMFENAGLPPYWKGCSNTAFFTTAVQNMTGGAVPGTFEFGLSQARRLETIGKFGQPVVMQSSDGDPSGFCGFSELTDKGRLSTLGAGSHLGDLYIRRLRFLPEVLTNPNTVHLRTTPLSRTLATLQNVFSGLYPPEQRAGGLGPVPIHTRMPEDEFHYPPTSSICPRYQELLKAFVKLTAAEHNDGPELRHVSSLIGKWLPPSEGGKVRMDGSPSVRGILDTIQSSLAAGPDAKLPAEFYDPKSLEEMGKLVMKSRFDPFRESAEFARLGGGPVLFDILVRMMNSIGDTSATPGAVTSKDTKAVIVATHDTTLGTILASLKADHVFTQWPPFTSNITTEMFRVKSSHQLEQPDSDLPAATDLAVKPVKELSEKERALLEQYYVRVKYNDDPVTIPACAKAGNHKRGDPSLCKMLIFKHAVDTLRPADLRASCRANLGRGILDRVPRESEDKV